MNANNKARRMIPTIPTTRRSPVSRVCEEGALRYSMTHAERTYSLLDVFTARPFSGNQLAVIPRSRSRHNDDAAHRARVESLRNRVRRTFAIRGRFAAHLYTVARNAIRRAPDDRCGDRRRLGPRVGPSGTQTRSTSNWRLARVPITLERGTSLTAWLTTPPVRFGPGVWGGRSGGDGRRDCLRRARRSAGRISWCRRSVSVTFRCAESPRSIEPSSYPTKFAPVPAGTISTGCTPTPLRGRRVFADVRPDVGDRGRSGDRKRRRTAGCIAGSWRGSAGRTFHRPARRRDGSRVGTAPFALEPGSSGERTFQVGGTAVRAGSRHALSCKRDPAGRRDAGNDRTGRAPSARGRRRRRYRRKRSTDWLQTRWMPELLRGYSK